MTKLLFLVLEQVRIFFKVKGGVFWVVLFPVVLVLILGMVFGGVDQTASRIGIVDHERSDLSRTLVRNLHLFRNLELHELDDGYTKALEEKKVDLVLVIEKGFAAGNCEPRLVYDYGRSRDIMWGLSTVRPYLQAFMEVYLGAEPPPVSEVGHSVQGRRYIDFLIPGVIGMLILSMAVYFIGTKLTELKENGYLKRMSIVPVSRTTFIMANILSSFVIIAGVTFLLLLEGLLVFQVPLPERFLPWLGFVFLGTLSFLGMGFLIPSFTSSSGTANTIGQTAFFLMMFLGGVYFPLENLPQPLRVLAGLLPVTYFNEGMRRLHYAELFDSGRILLAGVILLVLLVLSVLISATRFRWVED